MMTTAWRKELESAARRYIGEVGRRRRRKWRERKQPTGRLLELEKNVERIRTTFVPKYRMLVV